MGSISLAPASEQLDPSLGGKIPATCYGPEASTIHGIHKSVSLDSVEQVTRLLAVFLAKWCGTELLTRAFSSLIVFKRHVGLRPLPGGLQRPL